MINKIYIFGVNAIIKLVNDKLYIYVTKIIIKINIFFINIIILFEKHCSPVCGVSIGV